MKLILDSGIDYAVGAKMGMTEKPDSKFIDIGQLIHQALLGGSEKFVTSPYPDFRTKAAREWRDLQKDMGVIVVDSKMKETIEKVVDQIKKHPRTPELLLAPGIKHEQEMFATTAEGIKLRGKGDAIKLIQDEAIIITDIKTTAEFDKFFKQAYWRHYDLQAANYTLIGAHHMKVDTALVNYYFCVAETVAPYRVQYFHASIEFVESGERKLRTCIDEINAFGDKQPNFLPAEIKELGDWSN
jgi:vacuolar-type H+-ATPase subunit F/Vma7